MASVRKRGTRYQVRWRDSEGLERSRTCPDLKTARALKLDVEQAYAVGEDWRPRSRARPSSLSGVFQQYLNEVGRRAEDSTIEQYRIALALYLRHLRAQKPRGTLSPDLLSEETLASFFTALLATNNKYSAADSVRHVQRAWKWAFKKNRRFDGSVPLPEEIELPRRVTLLRPWAPSWSLADAVIQGAWAAERAAWYGDLMAVIRYTGLRKKQVMGLRWNDLDLAARRLYIRPDLGKSRQERRGRIVPVSDHLVGMVKGWDRSGGFLVTTDSPKRRIDNVTLRSRWTAVGVPEEELRQPTHALRKAFVTELRKAGADLTAIKALIGHRLDLTTDVYTTAEALMPLMEAALRLIPKIGHADPVVVPFCGQDVDTGAVS